MIKENFSNYDNDLYKSFVGWLLKIENDKITDKQISYVNDNFDKNKSVNQNQILELSFILAEKNKLIKDNKLNEFMKKYNIDKDQYIDDLNKLLENYDNTINKMMETKKLFKLKRRAEGGAERLQNIRAAQQKKGGAFDTKNPKKTLDREMKHKKPITSEAIFKEGEMVEYKDNIVSVKEPNGPFNTIGLLINNRLEMVEKTNVLKLDEQVLGMISLNDLSRLQRLAGVKDKKTVKEELDTLDLENMDYSEDEEPTDMNSDVGSNMDSGMDSETPDMDTADMGSDPTLNAPGMDDEHEVDNDLSDLDNMPAAAPVGAAAIENNYSEECNNILNALNTIQTGVPNIKISEYKFVLSKVYDVLSNLRNTGFEYLHESSKPEVNKFLLEYNMARRQNDSKHSFKIAFDKTKIDFPSISVDYMLKEVKKKV